MSLRSIVHVGLLLVRYCRGRLPAVECDHILPLLRADDICIDIGAHCGSWTWPLARRVKNGRVFAIEALPYYARLIRWLAKLLRYRNVQVLNYGATRESICLQLVWKDPAGHRLTGYTHLAGKDDDLAGTITIPGRPLVDLIPVELWPRVKFIKCDVEGAELGVFQGARPLLALARPVVYSEINASYCQRYGHGVSAVFSFFNELNYNGFVLNERQELIPVDEAVYQGSGDVWFYPGDLR